MAERISLSIETTCSRGGVALGRGDAIVAQDFFDASRRHAATLVAKLKALFEGQGLAPADLDELYVSVGPGSFTGTRVGVTVARTLAQMVPHARCVAVPTARAIAQAAMVIEWSRLTVLSDATEGGVHLAVFERQAGACQPLTERDVAIADLRAALEGPLLITGPAAHAPILSAVLADIPGVEVLPPDSPYHQPTPSAVWEVGRTLADAGQFTPYDQLLPLYSRPPTAVRVWEKQNPT